jgi:hypothetical protein
MEIIKLHPKVTVTIDTFQWGLVFFRKEQPKEHLLLEFKKNDSHFWLSLQQT